MLFVPATRTSFLFLFFFSSRRRHTRCLSDWSSDVCSSHSILAATLLVRTAIALMAVAHLKLKRVVRLYRESGIAVISSPAEPLYWRGRYACSLVRLVTSNLTSQLRKVLRRPAFTIVTAGIFTTHSRAAQTSEL